VSRSYYDGMLNKTVFPVEGRRPTSRIHRHAWPWPWPDDLDTRTTWIFWKSTCKPKMNVSCWLANR